MSILDDRDAFRRNPYFHPEDQIKGDFTPFYVAISICSVIGGFLIIINIAFYYCSQYKSYWRNRHTGNRWIQSLWTVTPHNNPPLDLSELEKGIKTYKSDIHEVVQYQQEEIERGTQQPQQYIELQKRESDI
ncbi:PREDICTED: uncharacterized protein LOC105365026 [Ceratosolen solmsi marchali]|uniref:Uncharacterized protein LOC105365026 n=1 Tax=Ceratosolen solmsi marchali TaxID=326594 RepID=A0AAJ6YNM2_9HYME|nr:PREDICTED: uncharacterized protein LOC105365026 [Ceratosolen solmsi marchali]